MLYITNIQRLYPSPPCSAQDEDIKYMKLTCRYLRVSCKPKFWSQFWHLESSRNLELPSSFKLVHRPHKSAFGSRRCTAYLPLDGHDERRGKTSSGINTSLPLALPVCGSRYTFNVKGSCTTKYSKLWSWTLPALTQKERRIGSLAK